MNYDQMTDFEINRKVLEIKTGVNPLGYAHDADGRSACVVLHGNHYAWFDFCNSWADAGPIIAKNLIALKPVSLFVGGHRWFATKGEGDFGIKAADNNPLRAAMIVFLMMQEEA